MSGGQATAPGKVILFGEHAVVYGRPAIAAPVFNVQATATVQAGGPGFRLIAADLQRDYWLTNAPANDPLAAAVRAVLAHWALPAPAATLTVQSTVPLGRGLGSGAAIATAVVRALADYLGQPLAPAQVSALVFEVEKLHHGTPSGIDNTVIAFEQPVYFIRERPIQRLRVARPFTLVIGDTGVSAATHAVVGDLRRRWQAEPQRYEGYFDEITVLARQAKLTIEQDGFETASLGKLMNENHEILAQLGVSSPELDRLVAAARTAGAWGAKLSGAGWGGNMVALTPPGSEAAVQAALTQAGAVGVIVTPVR